VAESRAGYCFIPFEQYPLLSGIIFNDNQRVIFKNFPLILINALCFFVVFLFFYLIGECMFGIIGAGTLVRGVVGLVMDYPEFEQFQHCFATEEACAEALWAARWPNGFQCPRCHGSRSYPIKSRRLYECADCRYQVSLIAGTVFENSRTPLTKWFLALYMISLPTGISAVSLQKMLQVTYKTAWTIGTKLRYAMSQDSDSQLLT
jgi:transposase-like protein